jgi:putative peptidoglycan lipid II flippase
MKAAIIALIVNVVASLVLMYPLKHNGIALASSIAAAVNVLVLTIVLKRKIGKFLDRTFYHSVFKIILSSVLMLFAIGLIEHFMPWDTQAGFKTRLIYLSATILTGAGAFFLSAYLLKSPEMHAFTNIVKKRLTRP